MKNISKSVQRIDLSKATIKLNEHNYPMKCQNYQDRNSEFSIQEGGQARITCLASIDKKMGLAQSDYRSIIEIPLAEDKAHFAYLIRAEDFK